MNVFKKKTHTDDIFRLFNGNHKTNKFYKLNNWQTIPDID